MRRPLHGLLPAELMLDHAEIDAQHDDILCRVEVLKDACLEQGRLPVDELRALIDTFAHHFATEERLAAEAGLSFCPTHRDEHVRQLRLFERAADELRAGKLEVRTFLRYLEYWFEHHINEHDKILGEHLADRARATKTVQMRSRGWQGIELSA